MNIKKNSTNTSATTKTQELSKLSDSTNLNTIPLSKLSDSTLYKLCKKYGNNSRKWSREFGSLLPEVYKRRLYRKYGCTSIHMFAAKLSGMNHDIVDRILNLNKKLENMPLIWSEFKKYGWTKLEVVARVATPETEKFWLDKLRKAPRQTLLEFVRAWVVKNEKKESAENPFALVSSENSNNNGEKGSIENLFNFVAYGNTESDIFSLNKTKTAWAPKSGYGNNIDMEDFDKNSWKKLKFKVDNKTEFEFRKYKQNLEKERKEALTMGETLKTLLTRVKKMEAVLETKNKRTNANSKPAKTISHKTNTHDRCLTKTTTSRYISKQLKKELIQKYKGKCSIPDCNHPYFEIHHPERFSYNHSHAQLYPLCKIHHQATHSGLIKNEDKPIEEWEFNFQRENNNKIHPINSESQSSDSQSPNSQFSSPQFSNFQPSNSQFTESLCKAYQLLEKEKIDAKVRSFWE